MGTGHAEAVGKMDVECRDSVIHWARRLLKHWSFVLQCYYMYLNQKRITTLQIPGDTLFCYEYE